MGSLMQQATAHFSANAPTAEKVSVLIADDHALVAETLAGVLASEGAFTVATAVGIDDALQRIEENGGFRVILLDYNMPGMNGLEGLERVLAANRGSTALFSGSIFWPVIERALELGASGYVPKKLSVRSFVNAVRFLSTGETYLPADVLRMSQVTTGRIAGLKPIEQSVLMLICDGLQNKEIGRELNLNEALVKMHVKSICGKLGAKNRTQAAMMAKRDNLA
jgi:two-component system nitrate/nitrite response regulator NarL